MEQEHRVPCQSTGGVHEGKSSREDIRKAGDRALVSHAVLRSPAGRHRDSAGKEKQLLLPQSRT